MTSQLSDCHFAAVMFSIIQAKHLGSTPEEIARCSFCGEPCELVPQAHVLGHDLELTLRRWKDGDCALEDMFERVNKELFRSWNDAANIAASTLQAGNTPKYELKPGYADWTETVAAQKEVD